MTFKEALAAESSRNGVARGVLLTLTDTEPETPPADVPSPEDAEESPIQESRGIK